ncbi:MAG: hypothetical protein IT303_13435 [Dehalococcoidia bacterium]|nr:hypothetical protein [Dehalococcoidia bacterium]
MVRGLLGTLCVWLFGAMALRAVVIPPEQCGPIAPTEARVAARAAAAWIERNQYDDGSYVYEYNADTNVEPGGYNVVRHAGVTMSLYQLAAKGDLSVLPAADRGLAFMQANLYRSEDWAAFQDPRGGQLKLGASALMLVSLEHRRIATGDRQHDELMREVGRFLLELQLPDGAFLELYDQPSGAPVPDRRSKYATGEAFWGLALLHEAFPGEGWDVPTKKVADYLSLYRDEVEDQKFPPWADQWAAYGLAEMAEWPPSDDNIAYARRLADRFGFLVRAESQRTTSWWSKLIHGRQARAAGAGTWVEALTSLHHLASVDPRMADVREELGDRVECGAQMLAERQVGPDELNGYDRPDIAEGAWFTEGITRMDDQQHALSGLLLSEPILAGRGRGDE